MKFKKIVKSSFNFSLVILIGLSGIYYFRSPSYEISATISDKLAVNSDQETLHFGSVLAGTDNTREFGIRNTSGNDIRLFFLPIGNIRKIVRFEPSNSIMIETGKPGKRIQTIVSTPPSEKVGKTYSGKIKIFRIPILF